MKILHFYHPNIRPHEQYPTLQFLAQLYDDDFEVIDIETIDPYDYEIALYYHWNRGQSFFILEQDKVPTVKILEEMRDCSEQICAANYILNAQKMGINKGVSAHRNIIRGDIGLIKELKHIENEEYADLYGFGLTKIIPFGKYPWYPQKWTHIDIRVSKYTKSKGYRAHIHPMVVHNHA